MSLHADGDAKPFGERHTGLEHPRSRPELPLAVRLLRGQRTAEDSHQRGFPVAGQLEEPGQFGTWISSVRRIELSTATTGRPDAVRVRLTWMRSAAGIDGSMSSPR